MHPTHWLISTQVDGGIKATPETIGACAAAGANCFIAGSGLFAYDDMSQAVSSTPSTRRLLDGVAMPVPHPTHWLISTQVPGRQGAQGHRRGVPEEVSE